MAEVGGSGPSSQGDGGGRGVWSQQVDGGGRGVWSQQPGGWRRSGGQRYLHVFFLAQTKMSWCRLLTSSLSESRFRAVQCYDDPTVAVVADLTRGADWLSTAILLRDISIFFRHIWIPHTILSISSVQTQGENKKSTASNGDV